MRIKPLHNQIIVKRKEALQQLPSGIFIPDNAKEKPDEAEVLAVGPGKLNEKGERQKMDVAVGDIVLFGKWAGQPITVDKEEYLVLKDDDIFAVITPE